MDVTHITHIKGELNHYVCCAGEPSCSLDNGKPGATGQRDRPCTALVQGSQTLLMKFTVHHVRSVDVMQALGRGQCAQTPALACSVTSDVCSACNGGLRFTRYCAFGLRSNASVGTWLDSTRPTDSNVVGLSRRMTLVTHGSLKVGFLVGNEYYNTPRDERAPWVPHFL